MIITGKHFRKIANTEFFHVEIRNFNNTEETKYWDGNSNLVDDPSEISKALTKEKANDVGMKLQEKYPMEEGGRFRQQAKNVVVIMPNPILTQMMQVEYGIE